MLFTLTICSFIVSRLFGRKEKRFSEKVFDFSKSRLKKFINITKSHLKKFYIRVIIWVYTFLRGIYYAQKKNRTTASDLETNTQS